MGDHISREVRIKWINPQDSKTSLYREEGTQQAGSHRLSLPGTKQSLLVCQLEGEASGM